MITILLTLFSCSSLGTTATTQTSEILMRADDSDSLFLGQPVPNTINSSYIEIDFSLTTEQIIDLNPLAILTNVDPITQVTTTIDNINNLKTKILAATSAKGNTVNIGSIQDDLTLKYTNISGSESDTLTFHLSGGTPPNSETFTLQLLAKKITKTCLLIYLAGDNNLNGGTTEYNINQDYVLKNLSSIITTNFNQDNLEVLIGLDVSDKSAQAYTNAGYGTLREGIYRVKDHTLKKISSFYFEPDTTDKNSLKSFLIMAKGLCKADRYILDIWGHGLGIFGSESDEKISNEDTANTNTTNNKNLSPVDMAMAISESELGIDVINFSACLMMDISVLHDIKTGTSVKAVAGSADFQSGSGSFYGDSNPDHIGMLNYLGTVVDPVDNEETVKATANTIATRLSTINYNAYDQGIQRKPTLSKGLTIREFLTYSSISLTSGPFANFLVRNNDNLKNYFTDEEISATNTTNLISAFYNLLHPYISTSFVPVGSLNSDAYPNNSPALFMYNPTGNTPAEKSIILANTFFYKQKDYANPKWDTLSADLVSLVKAIATYHDNQTTRNNATALLEQLHTCRLYGKHSTQGETDIGIGILICPPGYMFNEGIRRYVETSSQSTGSFFYQQTGWSKTFRYFTPTNEEQTILIKESL